MQKRHISSENQMKVIKALEYIDQQEEQENTQGLEILKSISKNISDKIFSEYYGKVLYQTQLTRKGNYSKKFLQQVALELKELTVGPGHILFEQNDYCSKFYILVEGSLEIYFKCKEESQNKDKVINVLKGHQEIGYKQFYCEQPVEFSARSQNVSRLVYLEREDFIRLLKKFPEDYEKYCNIKDNLFFNQVWRADKCYSCDSSVHTSNNCPYLFSNIKDQKVYAVRNHEIKAQQTQLRYFRRQRITKGNEDLSDRDFRINTLIGIDSVREELMRYRTDLISKHLYHIDYDLNDFDKDFYYNTPEILFNLDNTYYCNEWMNTEEEEFFDSTDEESNFLDDNDEDKYYKSQEQIAEFNKKQISSGGNQGEGQVNSRQPALFVSNNGDNNNNYFSTSYLNSCAQDNNNNLGNLENIESALNYLNQIYQQQQQTQNINLINNQKDNSPNDSNQNNQQGCQININSGKSRQSIIEEQDFQLEQSQTKQKQINKTQDSKQLSSLESIQMETSQVSVDSKSLNQKNFKEAKQPENSVEKNQENQNQRHYSIVQQISNFNSQIEFIKSSQNEDLSMQQSQSIIQHTSPALSKAKSILKKERLSPQDSNLNVMGQSKRQMDRMMRSDNRKLIHKLGFINNNNNAMMMSRSKKMKLSGMPMSILHQPKQVLGQFLGQSRQTQNKQYMSSHIQNNSVKQGSLNSNSNTNTTNNLEIALIQQMALMNFNQSKVVNQIEGIKQMQQNILANIKIESQGGNMANNNTNSNVNGAYTKVVEIINYEDEDNKKFIKVDLDRMKNYNIYFPNLNWTNIYVWIQNSYKQIMKRKYSHMNQTDHMTRRERMQKTKFDKKKTKNNSFSHLKFNMV